MKIYFLELKYHDGSIGAYDIFRVQDYWHVQELDGLPNNEYCCQEMQSAHAARLFYVDRVEVGSDGSLHESTVELRVSHHHQGKEIPSVFFYGQIRFCPFCGEKVNLEKGLQGKTTRDRSPVDVIRESYSTSTGQVLNSQVYVDGWLATRRREP